jgi:hypothetical protein
VAYATSMMWQEVERPPLVLSRTSFARKPFEQVICRLVEREVSHSDKTSLQRAREALTLTVEDGDGRWRHSKPRSGSAPSPSTKRLMAA